MTKQKYFIQILNLAKKHYGSSKKRLAGDAWPKPWQTLITTILSAQSRDETTIPLAEKLFKKFPTLSVLANAPLPSIKSTIKSINFYKTKSKNIKSTAQMLIKDFKSRVPDTIEELTSLPKNSKPSNNRSPQKTRNHRRHSRPQN